MGISCALVVAIVCLSVASTQRPAHFNVDKEVRKSIVSTRSRHAQPAVDHTKPERSSPEGDHDHTMPERGSPEGDHGHEGAEKSPFIWDNPHDRENVNKLQQIAGRIDWIIGKVVLGVLLLSPALPSMIEWSLSGHSPYPFLLNQNSVPSWPNNLYELVSAMALLGVDLILLAGVEYDWHLTMYWLRLILILQFGVLGFALHAWCIVSETSPYRSKPVPVPVEDASDSKAEDASASPASPFRDALFSKVMGTVQRAQSQVGHFQDQVQAWVHMPAPLLASTQYQDVGTPLVRLCVLFLAQCILVSFYCNAVEEQVELTPKAYAFWIAAIPMQIIAKQMMGAPFCQEISFWNDMLHSDADAVVQRGDDESSPTIQMSKTSCIIRSAMSYYANNFCIALIALTLPLFMLAAESEIEFVKDCFAVVFITTLDDLSESVALHIKPPLPV